MADDSDIFGRYEWLNLACPKCNRQITLRGNVIQRHGAPVCSASGRTALLPEGHTHPSYRCGVCQKITTVDLRTKRVDVHDGSNAKLCRGSRGKVPVRDHVITVGLKPGEHPRPFPRTITVDRPTYNDGQSVSVRASSAGGGPGSGRRA